MKNKKMWIVIAAAAVLLVVVILAVFPIEYPSEIFGRVYCINIDIYSGASSHYGDDPEYHLTQDGCLYEMNYSDGKYIWEYVAGPMRPQKLTEKNFDDLFFYKKSYWNVDNLDAQTIRERTVSAWSCTKKEAGYPYTLLYYVLLLENGDVFLCLGSKQHGMGWIVYLGDLGAWEEFK